ncbi:mitochondrial ribosomal death-associated protein 3-domain-containing protein [Entophlyctis helioformis]|nr:mitochondrial ribosomal death-associated protein 3-domain-containing protein [Entophlyctis helioformis]
MTLEEWSPRTAVKKNLGRFFKLPDSFMAKLAGLSPNVSLQFKLAGSPSLMLRESTLDLVQRVEAEGAKEACTTSFILDGSRGSGKSSTLLQTSSLLKSKGWIVILVPRMSQWTSGVEPYEKAASGDLYVQPVLAAKFLQLMMDWNAAAFAKIPAGNGSKQTIADVALAGIAKIDTAQTAVETVFSALFAAKDRAPVLLALDQIGAIYRTTSYFSSESKPLTADQFALPALIHKTLATLGQSRTAIVGAVDRTESLVSSRYFKYALKNMSPMNQSHGLLLSQVGTLDLASRDEFGVILPEYLDPTHSDAFSKSNKNPPKHLSRFVVPPYTKDEVAKALEFYKDNQVLFSDISDKLVAKRFMLTQGNPLGVFDSCVSL